MIRVLIFLLLLAAAALGISWVTNHPGEISLTWQGYNSRRVSPSQPASLRSSRWC